jgi:hypothetical protein
MAALYFSEQTTLRGKSTARRKCKINLAEGGQLKLSWLRVMSESLLCQLIGQFLGNREVIAYYPVIARALGGDANATVFLCQACYWQSKIGPNEFFYKLRDAERDDAGELMPPSHANRQSWEWETGLQRAAQESARRRLVQLGMLEESRRGVPARLHFRVNLQNVAEFLLKNQQIAENQLSGWQESSHLDGGKAAIKMAAFPPAITKTTTKNITENIKRTTTTVQQFVLEENIVRFSGDIKKWLCNYNVEIVQNACDLLSARLNDMSAPPLKNVKNWLVKVAADGAVLNSEAIFIQKRRTDKIAQQKRELESQNQFESKLARFSAADNQDNPFVRRLQEIQLRAKQ